MGNMGIQWCTCTIAICFQQLTQGIYFIYIYTHSYLQVYHFSNYLFWGCWNSYFETHPCLLPKSFGVLNPWRHQRNCHRSTCDAICLHEGKCYTANHGITGRKKRAEWGCLKYFEPSSNSWTCTTWVTQVFGPQNIGKTFALRNLQYLFGGCYNYIIYPLVI